MALEKERFQRGEDGGDTNAQLLECDLLILDDLGAEFPSQYVNAALYNVVNARILAERPTIISTNLNLKSWRTGTAPGSPPASWRLRHRGVPGQRRPGPEAERAPGLTAPNLRKT